MRTDILERKDEILQWIAEEQPKCYMCQQLRCKQETLNTYLTKMGIEYAGQQSKKGQYKGGNAYLPAQHYLENNVPISSHKLKQKLIRDGLKTNCCEICGASTWQGVPLPLELHHKDNNHYNNNLDNLIILCPNCHSVQPGNSGANSGKYVAGLEQADNAHLECAPISGMGSSPISNTKVNTCIDCGKEISKNDIRCKSCAISFRQLTNKPSREVLKMLIRNNSFVEIGRQFQVSDNAVRKWCKYYNLPHQATVIKQITDKEWASI